MMMEEIVDSEKLTPEYRKSTYKNRHRFQPDELRRRRETHHVNLRKAKRDEELLKRRKIRHHHHHHQTNLTGTGTLNDDDDDEDIEIRIDKNISIRTSNPSLVPTLQQLFVQLQSDQGEDVQLHALKTLASLLSPSTTASADTTIPPIDEAIALNFIPILMQFISSSYNNNYNFQYQALWALANIASGTEQHTKYLIENHKIIPALLNLIGSTTSIDLKEEALLCLGNLCIDNLNGEEVRNTIIIGGGLVKVIEIMLVDDDFNMAGSSVGLKRKASWCFMQLCKTDQYGRLPSSNWNVLRYILPQLYYIMDHENQDLIVLKDLLKSIEFLTHELLTNNRSNIIVDFRFHSLIIHKFLAKRKYNDLKSICISIMKNLITATSQKITQLLIDEGLLKSLFHIFSLASNSMELKKDCCNLVAMINQCSADVIQQVFATNLVAHLIHCLKNGSYDLKVEACNALCTAIQFSAPTLMDIMTIPSGTAHIPKQAPKIIPFLVSQGILSPLCEMLLVANIDLQVVILKSLERILATGEYLTQTREISNNEYVMFFIECGGKDIIETLINNAMNDEETDTLNEEYIKLLENLLKNYIFASSSDQQQQQQQRYDAVSTNSSDLSSSDYQFQFHTIHDGEHTAKGEYNEDNDIDTSLAPSIGEDGFFKFG